MTDPAGQPDPAKKPWIGASSGAKPAGTGDWGSLRILAFLPFFAPLVGAWFVFEWSWVTIGRIALLIVVFTLLWAYVVSQMAQFPLPPTWEKHKFFADNLRQAPFLILGVLWLTNFFPTEIINRVYAPRVLACYAATLLALLYRFMVHAAKPESIDSSNLRSKPVTRYVLCLIALIVTVIMALLTFSLIPAELKRMPADWWVVFWPWGRG